MLFLLKKKNHSFLSDGGTISPGPEGEILYWQENHQKQEEAGKGDESPQGTTVVITAEARLTLLHLVSNKLSSLFILFGQKHKKKRKAEVFNFSAIHLIHDPQGRLTCLLHNNCSIKS